MELFFIMLAIFVVSTSFGVYLKFKEKTKEKFAQAELNTPTSTIARHLQQCEDSLDDLQNILIARGYGNNIIKNAQNGDNDARITLMAFFDSIVIIPDYINNDTEVNSYMCFGLAKLLADLKIPAYQFRIACFYENGIFHAPISKAMIAGWYSKAANNGHPIAQYNIAIYKYNSIGSGGSNPIRNAYECFEEVYNNELSDENLKLSAYNKMTELERNYKSDLYFHFKARASGYKKSAKYYWMLSEYELK